MVGYGTKRTGRIRERMRPVPPPRHVLILAVDRAQSLDILGPVEVFHTATALSPEAGYRVELVAPGGKGEVTLSNGFALGADPLPDPPPRHDTLVVAGGGGAPEAGGGGPLRPRGAGGRRPGP